MNVLSDWADTRWSCWYDCAARHANHFTIFSEWLTMEARLPDCRVTMTDLLAWLQGNKDLVRLQAVFVVEHAQEGFEVMDCVQVAVAATFHNAEQTRKPKPHIHRVYNGVHTLHSSLQTNVEQKRLKALTVARLHKKQANRSNMYNAALWQGPFIEILESATQKLWKYVSKHLWFAKEARICDPERIATLPASIEDFPHVFPSDVSSNCTKR